MYYVLCKEPDNTYWPLHLDKRTYHECEDAVCWQGIGLRQGVPANEWEIHTVGKVTSLLRNGRLTKGCFTVEAWDKFTDELEGDTISTREEWRKLIYSLEDLMNVRVTAYDPQISCVGLCADGKDRQGTGVQMPVWFARRIVALAESPEKPK